mmetsp:Transcript_37734/g.57776  ORF Transcript_37734/g.57776 Transcript_37734/m.57776 type:complete len:85 (-) Transcript_37734:246-500(-)
MSKDQVLQGIKAAAKEDKMSIHNTKDFSHISPFIDAVEENFNHIRTGVQMAYQSLLFSLVNQMSHSYDSNVPNPSAFCEYKLHS